ncbi:josephin-2 [Thecamonas trahens ATCC 50062]|uniref:ubiquitinyl hydrolase 1 n=1 Tax=Thecamonas trahens ATCC 50062 TaxID=461836 RepID=A0A0L0D928_THETB|nr:josephin-2 [Thecamonas trahens ATCC 50062]KNC47803.1 josephin-2 [Thecamonas trahens ATCC 50062]|eukprot:XP_013759281.1 josephin-2 [Thecamonas trahens ATCC 50062]
MAAAEVYFERQKKKLCLVHSLNALLQRRAFTKAALDHIASELKRKAKALDLPAAAHKSMLGNYDVNVLEAALAEHGLGTIWWDSRRELAVLMAGVPESPRGGVVLNFRRKRALFGSSRHWITVTAIDGVWYNLDSKNKVPVAFSSFGDAVHFVASTALSCDGHVLVVQPAGSGSGSSASTSSSTSSSTDDEEPQTRAPRIDPSRHMVGSPYPL